MKKEIEAAFAELSRLALAGQISQAEHEKQLTEITWLALKSAVRRAWTGEEKDHDT